MNIDDYNKMIKAPTLEQLLADDMIGYKKTIDDMFIAKCKQVAAANPDSKQILYAFRYDSTTDSHFIDFWPIPDQTPPPIPEQVPA